MSPFCSNERCFLNALDPWPDDKQVVEVDLPDGRVRHYTRDTLVVKADEWRYPLCDSCGNIVALIRGEQTGIKLSFGLPLDHKPAASHGRRPFCANPRCWLHSVEVRDDHDRANVSLPSGASRPYSRDWIASIKDQRQYPICDACGNVAAAIRGDGEGLPAPTGVEVHAELIGPDGEVVDRVDPEPDAEIVEPETRH